MKGFKVRKVIWRHHHIIISKSWNDSSGSLFLFYTRPWWPLVKIRLSFFALHLVFSIAIEYVQYIRVKYAKKLKYRKVLITVEKLWLLPFPKINQNIERQKNEPNPKMCVTQHCPGQRSDWLSAVQSPVKPNKVFDNRIFRIKFNKNKQLYCTLYSTHC